MIAHLQKEFRLENSFMRRVGIELHLCRKHEGGETLGFPAFDVAFDFVALRVWEWEIEFEVFLTSARTSAGRIAHLAATHSCGLRSKRSRSSMLTRSRLVQSELNLICVLPLFGRDRLDCTAIEFHFFERIRDGVPNVHGIVAPRTASVLLYLYKSQREMASCRSAHK